MDGRADVAPSGATSARRFELRRVSLRKAWFDAPRVPHIYAIKLDSRDVDVKVHRQLGPVVNEKFELVLTIDVTASSNGHPVFRAIVEHVGVFDAIGYSDDEAAVLLRTNGATQVYPYAREFILSMISRSGFERLGLQPMTFDLPG